MASVSGGVQALMAVGGDAISARVEDVILADDPGQTQVVQISRMPISE